MVVEGKPDIQLSRFVGTLSVADVIIVKNAFLAVDADVEKRVEKFAKFLCVSPSLLECVWQDSYSIEAQTIR